MTILGVDSRLLIPVSKPSITNDEMSAVYDCVYSEQLSMGKRVVEFEREFARLHNVAYGVATTSGTTALHLALAALNIGPSDDVLVPDLTFVATANAVSYVGAKPILVDIDPETWCMSSTNVLAKITSATRAIIPVHLYGKLCKLPELPSHVLVVEDSAEATGYPNLTVTGDCACFSFYGNKVLTTGEGGMVLTNDESLAQRLRLLRGQAVDPKRRYYHSHVGYNYRMTELQAAVGLAQLSRLQSLVHRRSVVMDRYRYRLCSYFTCHEAPQAPWLFTILLPENTDRELLMEKLLQKYGIETRPTFVPMHRLPMFATANSDHDFPVSSRVGDRGLSLPTYPDLPISSVDLISDCLLRETAFAIKG